MNYLIKIILGIISLFVFSCVSPPDYSDGLLENIPAVINDNDYFSFSLFASCLSLFASFSLSLRKMILFFSPLASSLFSQKRTTNYCIMADDSNSFLQPRMKTEWERERRWWRRWWWWGSSDRNFSLLRYLLWKEEEETKARVWWVPLPLPRTLVCSIPSKGSSE